MHSTVYAGLFLGYLRMLAALTSHKCSWIWAFCVFWWIRLLAVPTVRQRNLDTLLPLGPFYPHLPTALHDNTAPLYHFSWLTLFSILHCSRLQALLCRKTLIKGPAVQNSISTLNISVYNVCWCPQTALLHFQIKHARGESCNICISPIHSAWFSTYNRLGEGQHSHFLVT